jgi:hypothetical protein
MSATTIDAQHERLLRSLEVTFEEAFASLEATFSSPATKALHGDQKRIGELLGELGSLLQDGGDALLCLPEPNEQDISLKEKIADIRKQINQITMINAKVAIFVFRMRFLINCVVSSSDSAEKQSISKTASRLNNFSFSNSRIEL